MPGSFYQVNSLYWKAKGKQRRQKKQKKQKAWSFAFFVLFALFVSIALFPCLPEAAARSPIPSRSALRHAN
jgi:hypothetical protein